MKKYNKQFCRFCGMTRDECQKVFDQIIERCCRKCRHTGDFPKRKEELNADQ